MSRPIAHPLVPLRCLKALEVAWQVACATLIVCAVLGSPAAAVEHVSLERDGKKIHVSGKVLVEAEDGGLLLLDTAGTLWAIQPAELTKRMSDDKPFEPMTASELADSLLKELPAGFRVHHTAHYLVCYNTSPAYAQWCGSLYERLYMAFTNYWKQRGLDLQEPDFPLVAVVFDNKQSYATYAKPELGEAAESIIGYYSLRSNHVNMYDLTGADTLQTGAPVNSLSHINRILSRPDAERTVATIIHEATHQLAFNCGIQQRYSDIPLWVSEGIAVYFETPDLSSTRGWRAIGTVHNLRLQQFRKYLSSRPGDSLRTLLANDQRFREGRTATDAYAEAWALNYYLLRKHPKEYVNYLRTLSAKKPLVYDEPEERLQDFRKAFGMGLDELDADFLRYMDRVR